MSTGPIRLSLNHKYRYSALLPDFNTATSLKLMVHGIRNSDLKAASRPVILYMDCKGPKSQGECPARWVTYNPVRNDSGERGNPSLCHPVHGLCKKGFKTCD